MTTNLTSTHRVFLSEVRAEEEAKRLAASDKLRASLDASHPDERTPRWLVDAERCQHRIASIEWLDAQVACGATLDVIRARLEPTLKHALKCVEHMSVESNSYRQGFRTMSNLSYTLELITKTEGMS